MNPVLPVPEIGFLHPALPLIVLYNSVSSAIAIGISECMVAYIISPTHSFDSLLRGCPALRYGRVVLSLLTFPDALARQGLASLPKTTGYSRYYSSSLEDRGIYRAASSQIASRSALSNSSHTATSKRAVSISTQLFFAYN